MFSALVVDDAPDIRLLVRHIVEKAGWRLVGEAEDGATGLAMCREQRPDAVLLDLLLPDSDGLEILRQIREEFPDQLVLMLTTVADEAVVLRCLKQGATGYILKDDPGWPDDLMRRLVRLRRKTEDEGRDRITTGA